MNGIRPQPPEGGDPLSQVRRDLYDESQATDEIVTGLELRIVALEEIVAARWPRSVLVRWQLARALRASVRHVQGDGFTERRTEMASTDWTLPGWMRRR